MRRFGALWATALAVAAGGLLIFQTRPLVAAFDWTTIELPPGPLNFDSSVALDDGVALLSGVTSQGVLLWWRDTSGSWQSQSLENSPTELARANDGVVAYRARSGSILVREGDHWVTQLDFELPAATRSRQASGRPSIVDAADGLLELSLFGDVWWIGRRGESTIVVEEPAWGHGSEQPFTSACQPPSRSSPDVPPIAATNDGVIAMTSSNGDEPFGIWPVCEPVIWRSTNAMDWSMQTTTLSDDGAYVYDIAWKDDILLAVGGHGIGRPSVWISEDGVEWVEVTPELPDATDLYRAEAGMAGWVILGQDSLESRRVGWTSTDTFCWEPLPSSIRGSEATVSDDGILLLDRTGVGAMWLAEPTGSSGICR